MSEPFELRRINNDTNFRWQFVTWAWVEAANAAVCAAGAYLPDARGRGAVLTYAA
jgi:hypothetical protein